ncbi:Ketosamine-3-kinase [Apiospora arundinis]
MESEIERPAESLVGVATHESHTGESVTSPLTDNNQAAFQINQRTRTIEDFGALGDGASAWWAMGAHDIPQHIIETIDDNVLSLLPEGTEIVSIEPHGNGNWTRSAEIQAELGRESQSYFIKATNFRSGKVMYQSEYESLKIMHDALPKICPEPIGWGSYASDPSVFFLLCHFVEIFNEPADPQLLPPRMANLHQQAIAPDGMYGWHVAMAGGRIPIVINKSTSWEDFFTRFIPRLLRPLETGGRQITPTLLHTNLWDGNIGVKEDG